MYMLVRSAMRLLAEPTLYHCERSSTTALKPKAWTSPYRSKRLRSILWATCPAFFWMPSPARSRMASAARLYRTVKVSAAGMTPNARLRIASVRAIGQFLKRMDGVGKDGLVPQGVALRWILLMIQISTNA